jgi:ABC-2 family transporter protein
VRTGHERLALIIPADLSARLDRELADGGPEALFDVPAGKSIALDLLVDPALRADFRLLVTIAIERILQGVELRRAMMRFAGGGSLLASTTDTAATPHRGGVMRVNNRAIETGLARNAAPAVAPTSAQQNVPAYCLLAIFMLVVPLSQTFIKERAQGSLTRLRSMPVPGWVIIGGKFVPYFIINLLQMALCLGVGRFVLPLLGGTALRFEHALGGVLLLSAAASVAAIAFALMVALFARTAEQATAFGATAILLLAALGGIMVPRILMPPVLQKIGLVSPLGWAQDGFLDLFVRGASAADVLDRAGWLLAFGLVCMALAGWRFATLDK